MLDRKRYMDSAIVIADEVSSLARYLKPYVDSMSHQEKEDSYYALDSILNACTVLCYLAPHDYMVQVTEQRKKGREGTNSEINETATATANA